MTDREVFYALDRNQEWYEMILKMHRADADERVSQLFEETERDKNGCWVTPTKGPRKVRYRGGQDRAYRFVFCIRERLAPTRDQVVRHRCHNRLCINPAHLEIGDRNDNLRDEWERQANGVDWLAL